jgi:glycosyltransferase involved in cell wall biosynthesis
VTLPTFVWGFVGLVGRAVGLYARGVRAAKRVAGRGRPAEPGRRPVPTVVSSPTVAAADAARKRLRDLLTPPHRFFQGLRYARLAGERAAALKPVAYHCHDLNSILAGVRARRRHPAPLIYDAHELWPHRNRPDARRRKTWVIERADRYFARRASAVITVNDSIAQHMQRRYGIRDVIVLRNTPSLTARSAPPERGLLDDIDGARLVYVGGIQTHRGLEEIIDAMPTIGGATFVAVGPGDPEYRAGLERRVAERGAGDRVRFVEWVPQEAVIATVAQADLGMCLIKNYCLSYYLSLPNKFFEYVHAGVPVLASDFPEMRRLVDTYELGVVCDPGDPAAIARAVNDLLGRPDDVKRMRDNALKASQELNWERERERLVTLYRRLVVTARS